MGAVRWLELDSNDNINISSATLIGTYTCDADRMVFATLYAQGLAGGGDYVYYVTVTPSGLSEGEGLKTTQTLGATTYRLFAESIGVALRNGDALKVYIDGLAGDTTNPDTRVNFWEDGALQPTVAGRTADIAATGEIGLDFDNVKQATGATTLTNITVPTVTDVTNGVSLSDANYTAARAAKLDNLDAAISSRPTAAQIWAALTSGLTTSGSIGKLIVDNLDAVISTIGAIVWAYASRTLTQSAAAASAAIEGSTWNIRRGDTLAQTFTGLPTNTGYTTFDLVVKHSKEDADADAVLWIRKNASGLNDGLLYINGDAPASAAAGSLTVVSATSLTVNLTAAYTKDLIPETGLYYAFQYLVAGVITEQSEGLCNVTADVVKAVS